MTDGGVMKRYLIACLLTGIAYGLILIIASFIFQGADVQDSSIVFGATLGILLHLVDIPRSSSPKASVLRSIASAVAVVAVGTVMVLAFSHAFPQEVFRSSDPSLGWTLVGAVSATVLIAVGRRLAGRIFRCDSCKKEDA
jgi:hypothetical protein